MTSWCLSRIEGKFKLAKKSIENKIYSIHVSSKIVCHEYQKNKLFYLSESLPASHIPPSIHSGAEAKEMNGDVFVECLLIHKQQKRLQKKEERVKGKINIHLLSKTLLTAKIFNKSIKLEFDFTQLDNDAFDDSWTTLQTK